MSVSTYVVGLETGDIKKYERMKKKYEKMKAVWDACISAKVDVPDEVSDFFGESEPDEQAPRARVVDLPKKAVMKFCAEAQDGFEVDLSKLPKTIKKIRFVNSY